MKPLQLLATIALLGASLTWTTPTAQARGPAAPQPPAVSLPWCLNTPRFQIFQAPKPYGGLIMLDTQTGQSWQRIVVNTPKGIAIRWMKLERKGLAPGETILWD